MIILKILGCVFVLCWIYLTWELLTSPIVDEDGNEIE